MVDPQTDETAATEDAMERLAVCPACREAIQALADELHDGLVQRIIAAKMVIEGRLAQCESPIATVESQTKLEPSALRDDLNSVKTWLEESLLEARSILDQFQLASEHEPISRLIERWSTRFTERVVINNQFGNQFDDLSDVETQIVARVFQSIVGNLLQHSDADRLIVRGERNDSQNMIEFQDNGSSCREDITPGVGLSAISRRIHSLGGSMALSAGETGFCVRITWPRR